MESLSNKGTTPPLPRMPETFQGSRGKSRERGIQGGGGIARKGYFALFCFFFVCVKTGYPLPRSLCKILVPLRGNLVRNGYPSPSKRTTPPTRNSEQSLREQGQQQWGEVHLQYRRKSYELSSGEANPSRQGCSKCGNAGTCSQAHLRNKMSCASLRYTCKIQHCSTSGVRSHKNILCTLASWC